MPGPLRRSLERMIPVLKAEEELRLCSLTAVGTGNVKRRDATKWMNHRRREMNGPDVSRAVRAGSWQEHFQNLAARGFSVRVNGEELAAAAGGDA